jgi:hypothetical protein
MALLRVRFAGTRILLRILDMIVSTPCFVRTVCAAVFGLCVFVRIVCCAYAGRDLARRHLFLTSTLLQPLVFARVSSYFSAFALQDTLTEINTVHYTLTPRRSQVVWT